METQVSSHSIHWALDRETEPIVNYMIETLDMITIMQLTVDLTKDLGLSLSGSPPHLLWK